MADVFALLIGLGVFGALLSFWRAGVMMARWRPAAAHVLADDYSDRERQDDRRFGGIAATWRNDDDGGRAVDSLVSFEDDDGVERRVSVGSWQRLGAPREGALLLWYDPRQPGSATTWGPFVWLGIGVALLVACAVLAGPMLPRS